jgi:hypothetical protein
MIKFIWGLPLLILLLQACEWESYRDYRVQPYDGVFTWTQVSKKAGWSNRLDHSALWYKDRLWVIGGYNPGKVSGDPYMEDVWSSADGEEWRLETDQAPWLGRRGHASVVFDDGSGEAMYVIGGFVVNEESGYREYRNDVWKSTDGVQWIQVKDREVPPLDSLYDWYPRFNHACVTASHGGVEYMYLVGGVTQLEDHNARYAMKYFNDVWRSRDGTSWERMDNNDFGMRAEHALAVDPETQRIYLQGGRHGEIVEAPENASHPVPDYQWLWHSDDGISWTPQNDTAEFDQGYLWRAKHQMVMLDGQLFGFPGRSSSNHHLTFRGGFWRLDPGNLWSVDSEGSDFNLRFGYAMVVHGQNLWILGGETGDSGPDNDVWHGAIK